MPGILKEGDKAPTFSLEADGGDQVALKDFAGKPLVLFLYPQDDTETCTKEAIAFSEAAAAFKKAGAAVLGLSRDSVASHDKFKKKYGLKTPLASDPDLKTIEAYQSWIEKSMYGRTYMGTDRSTFLIDGKGVIRRIWRKVRIAKHIDEVLAAVKAL